MKLGDAVPLRDGRGRIGEATSHLGGGPFSYFGIGRWMLGARLAMISRAS